MPRPGLCALPRSMPTTPPLAVREVTSLIAGILADGNRRHRQRIPLPFLLELQPCESSPPAPSEGTVVVGKDLSESGIGFFHQHRIPCQRVRLRLELAGIGPIELIAELLWCHFTRHGWYESGARIVAIEAGMLAVA